MTFFRFFLLSLLFLIHTQNIHAFGYKDAYYGHQSNQFFKKQKLEKSQDYLQLIKEQHHPSVQNNLGNIYTQQEKFEEAEKAYLNAIQSSSGEAKAKALYNLGNSYYQNSKFEQAIQAYKQALALKPQDKRIQKNMELTYRMMKINQPQKAKKQTQKQNQKDQKDQKQNSPQNNPNQDPQKKESSNQPNPQKNQDPKPSNELKSVLDTLEQREKQVRAKYLNKPKKEKAVQYDW